MSGLSQKTIDQFMRAMSPPSSMLFGTETMMHPDPGPDMPDLPQRKTDAPLLGYREWRLVQREGGWRLQSKHTETVWEGPILRADHTPDDRSPWQRGGPEAGNHGIYAWTLCAGPMAGRQNPMWPTSFFGDVSLTPRVEGVVELLGKVVVHARGYRAERCRIQRLWIVGDPPEGALADLSDAYHCDVETADDGWQDDYRAPQPEAQEAEPVNPAACPVCDAEHPTDPLACASDPTDRRLIVPERRKVRAPRPPEGWAYSEAEPMRETRPKPRTLHDHEHFNVEMDHNGNITITHKLD